MLCRETQARRHLFAGWMPDCFLAMTRCLLMKDNQRWVLLAKINRSAGRFVSHSFLYVTIGLDNWPEQETHE